MIAVCAGRETISVGRHPWQVGLAEDADQRSREFCRRAITSRVLGG